MEIDGKKFNKVLGKYVENIQKELTDRWNEAGLDIEEREVREVIFGMLSRQVSITIYYLSSPIMWNGDIGSIILRTIAENVINISWILKEDSLNRARMFIKYGLGQEKLQLEHRKNQMEGREVSDEEQKMIKTQELLINRERYTFLTDVNLGSWSEKSILKIAEEADCKDFYHYVFTPFSNSAHGTWNHIIKYSLKPSSNPLHCFIKRPIFLDLEPDPHFAELAMRYLDKTFGIFDKYYKPKKKIKNSYQIYLNDINMLIEKQSKNKREHGRLSDTQKKEASK